LKKWAKLLRENPHYKPDPMSCGLKNKRITPAEEEQVWKIITNDFLNEKYMFTDGQCN
jgi:hypothetical protein